jgi:hypothetical protein
MVELTSHDTLVLSRLVQFSRLPLDKRKELVDELKSEDARAVGEAILDEQKYAGSDPKIKETVERFRQWHQANRRLGQKRMVRRRRTGSSRSAS